MPAVAFTIHGIGCFADGVYGHQHCREKLAELLDQVDAGRICTEEETQLAEDISNSLRGSMPDDCWDEEAAIEILNKETDGRCHFEFVDGDLLLVPSKDNPRPNGKMRKSGLLNHS